MHQHSIVSNCSAQTCAYNDQGECHAIAITVGDGTDPHCDTFCPSSMHGGEDDAEHMVGACKVSNCKHNHGLICEAGSIEVGYTGGEVNCLTYEP